MSGNLKLSNFGQLVVTWTPVGEFIGLAKDSSATDVAFRENGGDLEMAGDGIHGTLMTDEDYSASAVVKLDESSPTYAALMAIYLAGKGTIGTLTVTRSNGETDTLDCAFIMDMGSVTDGYRAQNFREVTFHSTTRNYDGGELI